MISFSTEWQLLALAACFYIYDSALLLYVNEGILTPARRSWSIKLAVRGFTIRGKNLIFPNLLIPHRPVYRLFWDYKSLDTVSTVTWDEEKKRYQIFFPMVYGMAAALFVTLPLVFFLNRTDFAVLGCLFLIYLNTLLTGLALLCLHERLQLSRKKCWSIFLECLLCPPLTINVVRKISTQRVLPTSIFAAGVLLLEADQREIFFDNLLSQIDNQIEAADDHEQSFLITIKCELIKFKDQCH